VENKKTAVFGLYSDAMTAERAVDTLVTAGFSNNAISVLLPDNQSTKEFAHEKHTKAPEGTATGAAAGATVGGTLGLLAGIFGLIAAAWAKAAQTRLQARRRAPAVAAAGRGAHRADRAGGAADGGLLRR